MEYETIPYTRPIDDLEGIDQALLDVQLSVTDFATTDKRSNEKLRSSINQVQTTLSILRSEVKKVKARDFAEYRKELASRNLEICKNLIVGGIMTIFISLLTSSLNSKQNCLPYVPQSYQNSIQPNIHAPNPGSPGI